MARPDRGGGPDSDVLIVGAVLRVHGTVLA